MVDLWSVLAAPNGWPREWGGVGKRALGLAAELRTAPPKAVAPRLRLLQLMHFVGTRRAMLATTGTVLAYPSELLPSIAIGLNVERHWKAIAARNSTDPAPAVAIALGVDERTIRRWRAEETAPESIRHADEVADRIANWSGTGLPSQLRTVLYRMASDEVAGDTFFSDKLLWVFALAWGIISHDGEVTRGAIEVAAGGIRDPEAFVRASTADRGQSVNTLAETASVDRTTIREWRTEPARRDEYALNQVHDAAWAKFRQGRDPR